MIEYGVELGSLDVFLDNLEKNGIKYLQNFLTQFTADKIEQEFLNNTILKISGLAELQKSCTAIEAHVTNQAPPSIQEMLKKSVLAPESAQKDTTPGELSVFSNFPFYICEEAEVS